MGHLLQSGKIGDAQAVPAKVTLDGGIKADVASFIMMRDEFLFLQECSCRKNSRPDAAVQKIVVAEWPFLAGDG